MSYLYPSKLEGSNPTTSTVRSAYGPFNLKVDEDALGFEIEAEATALPSNDDVTKMRPSFWKRVSDGSLRATDEYPEVGEFISKSTVAFGDTDKALKQLDKAFKAVKAKFNGASSRTSVHLHVNVQHLTLNQLGCFMTLAYLVEPILCRFNGPKRESNLFCLQAIDSDDCVERFMEAMLTRRSDGSSKYSATNWAPLFNVRGKSPYGTVEFRMGAGIKEKASDCKDFVDIVKEIFTISKSFETPNEIIEMVSIRGATPFMRHYLPLLHSCVIGFYEDEYSYEEDIYEALRIAQPIAYDILWESYGETLKDKSKKKGWSWADMHVGDHYNGRTTAAPHVIDPVENYFARLNPTPALTRATVTLGEYQAYLNTPATTLDEE